MISISHLLCDIISPGDGLRNGQRESHSVGMNKPRQDAPRPVVVWNCTRQCNLSCIHCYASADNRRSPEEMDTVAGKAFIRDLADFGVPVILLSGGEPLLRKDLFDLAWFAREQGIRVVLSTNGTLITDRVAREISHIGFAEVGISLDFPVAELQDNFRGKKGAFEEMMAGIANAHRAGIEVQINSTITKLNVNYLDELLLLAIKIGAVAFHPFLLVPTGRGKDLEEVELSPQQYEETLNWIYDKQLELGDRMFFKPTDAPHYLRIVKQRQRQSVATAERSTSASSGHPMQSVSRGCLAGIGFCFISHRGSVQGCGYLDVEAGNVRQQSFSQIWSNSTLFRNLRNLSNTKGKCGVCEFKRICGGCRARAYEATGDYLEAEPYCVYQPAARRRDLIKVED